jgi:hypothetical protein
LDEWQRLRDAGRGWPVIVGNDADLYAIAEQFSADDPDVMGARAFGTQAQSPERILAAADKLKLPEDLPRVPRYRANRIPAEGNWPGDFALPAGAVFTPNILERREKEHVHMLLIPARGSWEVPAYLRWGGWNDCPAPEYHVAALRHWHERYGAELVTLNRDSMNLRVSRLPKGREEAMALAREHLRYCPESIDPSGQTIADSASWLTALDWWFFWWD